MKRILLARALALGALALLMAAGVAHAAARNPFLGSWALDIPGGGAGWLGVAQDQGKLSASILWGGGSVVPVNGVALEGGKLVLTRISKGKTAADTVTETITATRKGRALQLTTVKQRASGAPFGQAEFTGKRLPPPPPAPDLSKVKFGAPVKLFNGVDLKGWTMLNPKAANGWSVKEGVLTNNPAQEEGKPHKAYSNIRTDKEFEDFNLTLEANVPKAGNSGIYLRGVYEVQVEDSFGKPLDSHNMGAVYSRLTPTVAAEKPAGEWQTLDITLVKRHVTVILNGKKIIDNQPLLGCTGGALWSDIFRPGPIYLQGDHTGVNYRNIVLRPVVK